LWQLLVATATPCV